MINNKLPRLHQPLVDLIRSIAPDLKAELSTSTDDTCHVYCSFDLRAMTIRHKDGDWYAHHSTLDTELDLVERLCWLVDAPRLAGPADVAEMRERAKDREDPRLYDLCAAALAMNSAAILACSRALPNNDWRKHQP